MTYHTFTESKLRDFTKSIFIKMGCSAEHAILAADVLIKSDLRGIDSHGVARLTGYVRLWEKGRINAKPDIRIVYETPTTATVDGDAGLGLVVAPFEMKVAIEKAEKYGEYNFCYFAKRLAIERMTILLKGLLLF